MDRTKSKQINDVFDRVDQKCAELLEHCDSVRIFVTIHDSEEGTHAYNKGGGNVYAQLGQINDYKLQKDETVRTLARRTAGDDGEY
ncbi:hypothetical protein KAR91_30360 [Candidatus Pacearchaeota archaeon]|nr:hypothetical protein [Candidatus Pacearchaeota archaeon]